MKKHLVIMLTALIGFQMVNMPKAEAKRRPMFERFFEEARKRDLDRRAGKSPKEFTPEVRDFLTKHAITVGSSYTKLKSYIGKISENPAELRSFKEILSDATATGTPAAKKALLNKLTGHLIELQRRDASFKLKVSEVERASKEWTREELVELESVMRDALGSIKDGKSADQALKDALGTEAAAELKKSCK